MHKSRRRGRLIAPPMIDGSRQRNLEDRHDRSDVTLVGSLTDFIMVFVACFLGSIVIVRALGL